MKTKIMLLMLCLMAVACTSPDDTAARAQVTEDTTIPAEQQPESPESVVEIPIDKEMSTFEFEGYGPGKSHIGSFSYWNGSLYEENGLIVGGRGVIDAASVDTGIGGLDSHLRNEDFFHTDAYPNIVVQSRSYLEGMMTADVTLRGITRKISFPAEATQESISADFVLDASQFGIDYRGVNDEVRIAFSMFRQ